MSKVFGFLLLKVKQIVSRFQRVFEGMKSGLVTVPNIHYIEDITFFGNFWRASGWGSLPYISCISFISLLCRTHTVYKTWWDGLNWCT